MKVNKKKDELQQKWAQLFIDSKTRRHSEILATGTGKSRMAMLVMEKLNSEFDRFIILVDSTRLRDFNWKDDFKVWDKEHLFDKTDLYTYQAAYKWKPETKDLSKTLIIADEIDFAIGTPKYGNFFRNFTNISILGFTGYVTDSKREELNDILPILIEYSFEQGVKDGILNDVKFIFVKYDLGKNRTDVTVNYKKDGEEKSFTQSENAAYDYATTAFNKAYAKYSAGLVQVSMGMLTRKDFVRLDKIMQAARNKRTKCLYNGVAAKVVAQKLVTAVLKNPENKVVVFSKYTSQSSKITDYTYHGKNSEKINDKNYADFNNGEIRELGICDKINRGVNMVGLNNIILESFNSSDTIIRQRAGRGARLEVTDTAHIYVMLPYYMKKTKTGYEQTATQAVTWAENMLKGYDTSQARIIDIRTIKDDKR